MTISIDLRDYFATLVLALMISTSMWGSLSTSVVHRLSDKKPWGLVSIGAFIALMSTIIFSVLVHLAR